VVEYSNRSYSNVLVGSSSVSPSLSPDLPITAVAMTKPRMSKATCVRLPFGSVSCQGASRR
jgi:hypothetical protein